MRHIYKSYAIVLVAALLLVSCKDNEPNPLLGEWSLVKTAELNSYAFKMAQISGNGQLTFQENQIKSGKYMMEVSYTVSGNEVSVHYTNGDTNTYVIEDSNYFVIEMPAEGKKSKGKSYKYERSN